MEPPFHPTKSNLVHGSPNILNPKMEVDGSDDFPSQLGDF